MKASHLLTASVLLGALLLFGMEPMVGRMLVPFYGSAVSTWLTALMFFQVLLFGGYLYAHVIAPRIGRWHLAVLLLPLINLPIGIQGTIAPEAPTLDILGSMLWSIGLPFFVLSTSAVVLQIWWSRSEVGQTAEPYPLYSASNTGSLVALLGYPFVVEPLLGLQAQSTAWTMAYLVYVGVVAAAFFKAKPDFTPEPTTAATTAPPSLADLALWALLASLPSGFLLAVTSLLASEVGSFPMIWVMPLAAYLGTFVLLFRDRPIGMGIRGFWPEIFALGMMGYAATVGLSWLAFFYQLTLFTLYCMAVHGELYARRPEPRWLTRYYLAISFGGGVGGMVVNFLPPVLFPNHWEYPILVVFFGVVFAVLFGKRLQESLKAASLPMATGRMLVVLGPLAIAIFGFFAIPSSVHSNRNFYGIFRVQDRDGERLLIHGSTDHGSQLLDPDHRQPIGYYYAGGPMHDIYQQVPAGGSRIAVFGLGTGATAGLCRAGDVLDFFEIDPANEAIARKYFSYIADSPAKVSVYVGDGRLKFLEMAEPYHLLHVDAFSGDGIPSHLITTEAVAGYLTRLTPDGMILFHISNRYYDLRPVVKRVAEDNGMHVLFSPQVPVEDLPPLANHAIAVVAARDPARLEGLRALGWHETPKGLPESPLWTDDYVNLLLPLWWGFDPVPIETHSR